MQSNDQYVKFYKCTNEKYQLLKENNDLSGCIIFITDKEQIILDDVIYCKRYYKLLNNITVSQFTNITEITDNPYNYYADINADVTSNDFAEVVFDVVDAISGNLSPVCDTFDGYIRIYSKSANPININTIIIYEGQN